MPKALGVVSIKENECEERPIQTLSPPPSSSLACPHPTLFTKASQWTKLPRLCGRAPPLRTRVQKMGHSHKIAVYPWMDWRLQEGMLIYHVVDRRFREARTNNLPYSENFTIGASTTGTVASMDEPEQSR